MDYLKLPVSIWLLLAIVTFPMAQVASYFSLPVKVPGLSFQKSRIISVPPHPYIFLRNSESDYNCERGEEHTPSFHSISSSTTGIDENNNDLSSSLLRRTEQIEKLQGTWWTSERKQQLVQINSSYAIFDCAPQCTSRKGTQRAVMYPLGGTDEIVTLRTFKLVSTYPIPQWAPSPTSKENSKKHQYNVNKKEEKSNKKDSSSSNSFCWELCANPEKYWKSNRNQAPIPGYEESLSNLIQSGGPIWSSSPVDIVRACIKGVQSGNIDLVSSVCRFQPLSKSRHSRSNQKSRMALFDFATISSWSIARYHHYSPDVCTLHIKIDEKGGAELKSQYYEFRMSRDDDRGADSKLPPSLSFDSVLDIKLCVEGKVWRIDNIQPAFL